jgi:membrane protein involved in colicin uptake
MTTMTTFNNETFTNLFPRADVREYLRKECAKKNLTTMTEEEKDTLYNNCAKTVDADNNQISPKPKDQFKNADWVKEIITNWDRVEEMYIPNELQSILDMKSEKKDALNAKFEAKEETAREKAEQREEAKQAKKQAKIDAKEQAKQAKIDAKEEAKQAKIDAKEQAKQLKIQTKERAKILKRLAKEEAKKAKTQAKEKASRDAKALKTIIRVAVKKLTDSDKRVLISESSEWISENTEYTATNVDQLVIAMKAADYKKLITQNEEKLKRVSWYSENEVNIINTYYP